MGELACKPAGLAISAAARVLNPACQARCLVRPLDQHPREIWGESEFPLRARN